MDNFLFKKICADLKRRVNVADKILFFVYEGIGETDGRETITNSFFFEKRVRWFLKNLKFKQDGIFEIDLRLRPFGEKRALASSLEAFSEYYSIQGPAMQFEKMASRIRTAYQCLRRVIEALRVVRGNAKDLNIPDFSSNTFHYLARRMRYAQSSELASVLKQSMDFGNSLWEMPLGKS